MLLDTWTVVLRCPGAAACGVTYIMKTVLLSVFAVHYRIQLLYHVTPNSVALQPSLALSRLSIEACRQHKITDTHTQ